MRNEQEIRETVAALEYERNRVKFLLLGMPRKKRPDSIYWGFPERTNLRIYGMRYALGEVK